jgi:hypothetical protein
VFFTDSSANDYGARLVDINNDGLVDILVGYNFGHDIRQAWINNGNGWENASNWVPPDVFTSSSRPDNGIRFLDVNGDGLADILQDYKNGSSSEREAFINTGSGWRNSSSWISPEPFTKDGKNIARRIADVNGDGFGDILVSNFDTGEQRVLVKAASASDFYHWSSTCMDCVLASQKNQQNKQNSDL